MLRQLPFMSFGWQPRADVTFGSLSDPFVALESPGLARFTNGTRESPLPCPPRPGSVSVSLLGRVLEVAGEVEQQGREHVGDLDLRAVPAAGDDLDVGVVDGP
jgi:hypothetical protein